MSEIEDDPYGVLGLAAGAGKVSGDDMIDICMRRLAAGEISDGGFQATAAIMPDRGCLARPGDTCRVCGSKLQVSGIEYECVACHAVFEAANIDDVLPNSNPETPGGASLRGRLRVVGPDHSWYQPDIDRTNPGESSEQQKKTTYAELLRFNREYESRGGNPFPIDVLQDVAEHYYIVQQDSVKRSMMKKGILAALVFNVCIDRGFTRTRAQAAEFAKLPNHGIARGDDYLRKINEEKGLDINMNADRLDPHITTTFALLGLEDGRYAPLREAVAEIVRTAIAKHIGHRSAMRSKVTAATAEVLLRRGIDDITPEVVSKKCGIRIHTLRRFLKDMADYHTHFEDIYATHGIVSTRAWGPGSPE